MIAKTYPGFTVVAFNALIAPAGAPAALLEKISADVRAMVTSPVFARAHQGARHQRMGLDAEGARCLVRAARPTKWAEIAKAANLKAE